MPFLAALGITSDGQPVRARVLAPTKSFSHFKIEVVVYPNSELTDRGLIRADTRVHPHTYVIMLVRGLRAAPPP